MFRFQSVGLCDLPPQLLVSESLLLTRAWKFFGSFCIFFTPHFECDLHSFPKHCQPLPQRQ